MGGAMTDYWSPQRAARYDFWTPARIEQLKLLRAEGKSATEIAAELGAVSRNAIIGKLARHEHTDSAQPAEKWGSRFVQQWRQGAGEVRGEFKRCQA